MNALRLWSTADEARMWLLCLPAAGCGARFFKSWADGLPTGLGVAALELPGRGTRIAEPLAEDISEVVAELARSITPLLDRPVIFFGHSMGAILAFDLARALRAERGWQPLALIAAASEAPDQQVVPVGAASAPDQQLVSLLRRWGGTSEELFANPEFLAQMLPIVRGDLTLMERRQHRDEPPLDCPVRAYLGALDRMVDRPAAEQGWIRYTAYGRPARIFPGGHFFVQESAELVLAALAEDANEAVGGRLLDSGKRPSARHGEGGITHE